MNKENILEQINIIGRDVFDDESIVLTDLTTANDVEDWDSITHVQLLFTIEKQFGIKFTSSEIAKFKNIGEIVACILSK